LKGLRQYEESLRSLHAHYNTAADALDAVAQKADLLRKRHDEATRKVAAQPQSDTMFPSGILPTAAETELRSVERSMVAEMNRAATTLRSVAKSSPGHKGGGGIGSQIWGGIKRVGGFLGDVGLGIADFFVDTGKLIWTFSPVRGIFDYQGYWKSISDLGKAIPTLGSEVRHHPGSTLYKVFDVHTLKTHPGRWIGKQIPLIVLTIATGGVGGAAEGGEVAGELGENALGQTTKIALEDAAEELVTNAATGLPRSAIIEEGAYKFTTDSSGRLTKAAGELEFGDAGRSANAAADARKLGEVGDQAGHLIARRFNGPKDLYNLVPQDAKLNMGLYKKMENEWAAALNEGKSVKVSIEVEYTGSSTRPTEFVVDYQIEGRPSVQKTFLNEARK
jgi:hypothetical protein